MTKYQKIVSAHYQRRWGKCIEFAAPRRSANDTAMDHLRCLVFRRRTTNGEHLWVYATAGMSDGLPDPIEVYLYSPVESELHLQTITAIAAFHKYDMRLGVGHTVNIGRPWLPGSMCDHALVSFPHFDGPKTHVCPLARDEYIECLWLVPITEKERSYKVEHGLEALEQRFEESRLKFFDPQRASVV